MLGAAQAALLGASSASASARVVLSLDAQRLSDYVYSGSVEHGIDPLLDGGGPSIALDGIGTSIRVLNEGELQVPAVSIEVYVQADTAPTSGNRQIVYKDDGLMPGGFAIEQWSDGLRVYTKDTGGVLQELARGIPLIPGTAHRIVLTFGPDGRHLYVDNVEVASDSVSTGGLASNKEDMWIGSYLGAFGFFDGVIGLVQIYDKQLSLSEIQARPAAQSVSHAARRGSYTVPTAPTAPGASAIYVATDGNDTTGDGTIGNPYLTLAKAISVAPSSNGEIVLRKGAYRNELNLNAGGKTNLTIRGYAPDIAADPLNPDNWPILDKCFTGVTWQSYNISGSYHEYRTTAVHGTGTAQGWAVAGTTPYQHPRWEPLGGRRVPTPVHRLYSYLSGSGARTGDAFRRTSDPTGPSDWSIYLGPGVYRESTGRIHIRLDRINPASVGGVSYDPFTSKDPANNQIWLWQDGNTLFSSIGSGFTFEGIFVRGYSKFWTGAQSNVTLKRSVFWCGQFDLAGFIQQTGTGNNWLIQHNVCIGGQAEWTSWQVAKQGLTAGYNYGEVEFLSGNGGSSHTMQNLRILDNLALNFWEWIWLSNLNHSSGIEYAYNAVDNRDDAALIAVNCYKQHYHHNYVEGPFYGCGVSNFQVLSDAYEFYSHHNVVVCNRSNYIFFVADCHCNPCTTPHTSVSGQVIKEYHNTYIGGAQSVYSMSANMARPMPIGYSGGTQPHYTFNNIFCWYVQVPPGGSNPTERYWSYEFAPNDSGRKWFANGNGYHDVYGPGVSGSHQFWNTVYPGARGSGGAVSYASLEAWRLSATYNSTGSTGWNYGGRKFEQDGIQADPQFANAAAITQDARYDAPPADYKPDAAAYRSGAIDITSFGWPGAESYEAWRGALDPDGDGSEVGPRAAGI